MASYSTDATGVYYVRDDKGVRVFDRVNGISVAGWSRHPALASRYKACDETTGRTTSHPA